MSGLFTMSPPFVTYPEGSILPEASTREKRWLPEESAPPERWISMQFWDEFEGAKVEGTYLLSKFVRSEGRSAWFETAIPREDGGPAEPKQAIIELIESLNDEESMLDRLEAARRVKHASLVSIYTTGRTRLKDTPMVYALMEYTDQNLADAIRDHSLTKDEVAELAQTLSDALAVVHGNGFVHTRMEAASVLAAGETIKLRSDCLQAASEAGTSLFPENTASEDVRGFGSILFQALTQRAAKSADDPEILQLPAPLSQIVRNTLNARWTLKEVRAALRPVVSTPVTEPPSVPAVVGDATVAARPPMVATTFRGTDTLDDSARLRKRLVLAVAAIAVLLIVTLLALRSKKSAQGSAQDAAPESTQSAPAAAPGTAATPVEVPKSSLAAAGAISSAVAAPATGRGVWRVVAFTYNRQGEAEHKAREISKRHESLQPEVFSPKESRARYLVTLGGAMTREQAFHLREKARRAGLPRDTYARNFTE